MLGIEIVCVGKLNQKYFKEGCDEYLKRLGGFCRVRVSELPEVRLLGAGEAAERRVVEEESARILAHLDKRRSSLVALCVEGREMTSPELAAYLADTAQRSPEIAFVIGSSLGLSDALKQRADLRMSMSRLTLPHQLARLVLLEQLYRACTINANIKYHK